MSTSERAARVLLHNLLARVRRGRLTLHEAGREHVFGDGDGVRASMEIHSPAVYPAFLRGSVGLAETYMQGLWDSPDLVALTRLGARNMAPLDAIRARMLPLTGPALAAAGWCARNTPARSRRRIAAHYDLGNELFAAMLDETLSYSCAIYPTPDATLGQAQTHKLETICRTLELCPGEHVLEIGTGWGAFAVYAAAQHGVRVTTTTISREQRQLAVRRVREMGLEDRVTVLEQDYRQLRGSYDKLVSIEMIEAVGWLHLDTFFRACSRLLTPNGKMLLQAITIRDDAYEVEKAGRSFIKRYIFPGGSLPSKAAIAASLARVGDLQASASLDLTAHYPTTLRAWRERFARYAQLTVTEESFRRLWNLYLCYCEGGFIERRIEVGQMLLAKAASEAPARARDLALAAAGR